ncbi:PREDICTED: urea transporter 2-like isoform X3 [Wasmannia auropunctata]|uniref:urea transporter 2-like isoform X3 n=1 Tax=Wasmannia auropunctata TaxID=64793 RepID=UPI0005EDE928|nr:PREDICTED: urea transporter 2-like isoform X3 [Wasmannia auropunctata]
MRWGYNTCFYCCLNVHKVCYKCVNCCMVGVLDAVIKSVTSPYDFNIICRCAMSAKELPIAEVRQEKTWVAFVGDFAILKDFFAQKTQRVWHAVQLLDSFLRGFGQLMREPDFIVENGLSVYNPLLVGAVSYGLIPQIYGAGFDTLSCLLVLLATILSVYLSRSLRSDKFSCTTWPFNLVEFALIFILSTQNGAATVAQSAGPMFEMHNATSETTTTTTTADGGAGFHGLQNTTGAYIDWGMVVRGSVVSASQLFGVDNVIVGSVMYLAMLIYSPVSTAFSYFGALCGTFAGLELGADCRRAYSGMWGYNSLLTGAALGGNLLVLNGQTAVAAVMAIIYTSLLQYAIESIFAKAQLPVLTLPFVIATSLFLKLSDGKEDPTFPWPVSITFPEKQRHYYVARRAALREEDAVEELELDTANERRPVPSDN